METSQSKIFELFDKIKNLNIFSYKRKKIEEKLEEIMYNSEEFYDIYLVKACECGLNNIALFLLTLDLNVNFKDDNGYTSILYAASECNELVVENLINKGAKCDIINEGNTPLINAIKKGRRLNALHIFNTGESLPNHVNNQGDTAFLILCSIEFLIMENIREELFKFSDLNHSNNDGYTVLMYECKRQENEDYIINTLLNSTICNFCSINNKNESALFYAIENSYIQVSLYLINMCPQLINIINQNGYDCMNLAIDKGLYDIVNLINSYRTLSLPNLSLINSKIFTYENEVKSESKNNENGFNPITLKNINIELWISKNNRLVLLFNSQKICLKKKYFNYLTKIVDPRTKIKYFSLKMIGLEKIIITETLLNEILTSEKKILKLENTNIEIKGIYEEILLNEPLLFENIDISEYENFFGFDTYESFSLKQYTTNEWFSIINTYLRNGNLDTIDIEDDTNILINKANNIIYQLDKIFSKTHRLKQKLTVWRGTKNHITDIPYLGVDQGYISTSTEFDIAKKFLEISKCCLYKINLEIGMPYLIMDKYSSFENKDKEHEILLPRGCNVILLDKYYTGDIFTYEVKIEPPDKYLNLDFLEDFYLCRMF